MRPDRRFETVCKILQIFSFMTLLDFMGEIVEDERSIIIYLEAEPDALS